MAAGLAIYLFFVCLVGVAEAAGMLIFPPLGAATGAINVLLHRLPRRAHPDPA